MKKIVFIMAVLFTVALASCTCKSSEAVEETATVEEVTDSIAPDTTLVMVVEADTVE